MASMDPDTTTGSIGSQTRYHSHFSPVGCRILERFCLDHERSRPATTTIKSIIRPFHPQIEHFLGVQQGGSGEGESPVKRRAEPRLLR